MFCPFLRGQRFDSTSLIIDHRFQSSPVPSIPSSVVCCHRKPALTLLAMVERSPELQGFVLQNIKRTGVHLGIGSYGEVEELCWNGTKCAGKCLHDTLLDRHTSSIFASKFVSECRLIAKIRHPNVVQFLGLCFFPDYRNQQRLYLVMEKLHDNLSNLLESKPNIQLSVKCSILLDVSRGLVHLHSNEPPIVHRDLSSRNILLTASMQAKIADLGTARMISTQKNAERMQHTPTPGTPLFMPPEANTASPKYDSKLDIFSFGQVMLHTLTQVFPYELLPPTHETPSGKIRGRSEVERREKYMELLHSQLKKDHQLSRLTASCFENAPRRRPTAKEVMTILEEFHLELENAGMKYNAFSKISSFIQDKHDSPAKMEGKSAMLDEDGRWNFELRKRSATFIESHILVSYSQKFIAFELHHTLRVCNVVMQLLSQCFLTALQTYCSILLWPRSMDNSYIQSMH